MTETSKNGDKNKKSGAAAEAPKTTAAPAPAQPAGTQQAHHQKDDKEEWVEFNTGFFQTDGFWQNPVEGEWIDGVLLGERRVTAGSALKQPYYIFELYAPFARMTTRIDPNKPGTKDNQQVIVGDVGKNIGVRVSYNLQHLMRKVGHRFRIKYLGKVPTKSGNTVAKFKVASTARKYKEIEQIPENAADAANDEVVGGDEIPF